MEPGYLHLMNLIPVAAFLLGASANPTIPDIRPIEVVVGESIAKVKIGMDLHSVMKLVRDLAPEGTRRGSDRTAYVSGALRVVVDESSHVVSINVDLPKSPGLRAGKTSIPPQANLEQIQQSMPHCQLSSGSGGRVLECEGGKKGKMHFYDSFSDPSAVWAILP